jgi:hypothetical protein
MTDPKKQRTRRGEPLPSPGVLVLRGDLMDPVSLTESAAANEEIYRYFGISVFVEDQERDWRAIAEAKLSRAEWIALFRAGDVVEAGLQLWDTGQSPHYDVVHSDCAELVAKLLGTPHRTLRNPAYEPPQEGE